MEAMKINKFSLALFLFSGELFEKTYLIFKCKVMAVVYNFYVCRMFVSDLRNCEEINFQFMLRVICFEQGKFSQEYFRISRKFNAVQGKLDKQK